MPPPPVLGNCAGAVLVVAALTAATLLDELMLDELMLDELMLELVSVLVAAALLLELLDAELLDALLLDDELLDSLLDAELLEDEPLLSDELPEADDELDPVSEPEVTALPLEEVAWATTSPIPPGAASATGTAMARPRAPARTARSTLPTLPLKRSQICRMLSTSLHLPSCATPRHLRV